MPSKSLSRTLLTTEQLLNARWILEEELGTASRAESDAAVSRLDALRAQLSRAATRLGALSREAFSVTEIETTGDEIIGALLEHSSPLAEEHGLDASDEFFVRACMRGLLTLEQQAARENETALESLARELRAAFQLRSADLPELPSPAKLAIAARLEAFFESQRG